MVGIQLIQHSAPHWMRVSEEHTHIPVPTDEGHFRSIQAHLEEPADGFMPKVMEVEIINPSSTLQPLPSKTEGISCDGEH